MSQECVAHISILKSQNAPTSSGGGDDDACSQTPTRALLSSSQEPRTDGALPVQRRRRVSFAQERTVKVFETDVNTDDHTTALIDGEEDMDLTRCGSEANRTQYGNDSMDLTIGALSASLRTLSDEEADDTMDFLDLMAQKKKRRTSVDFARTAMRRASETRLSISMDLTNVTRGCDDNVDEEEEGLVEELLEEVLIEVEEDIVEMEAKDDDDEVHVVGENEIVDGEEEDVAADDMVVDATATAPIEALLQPATAADVDDMESTMLRMAERDDELSAVLDTMEEELERYITRRKADDARVAKSINDRAVCRDLGVRIVEENGERIVFEYGGVRVNVTLDDGETVTHVDVELKHHNSSTISSSLYTHILRHHTVLSRRHLLRQFRRRATDVEVETIVSHVVQTVVEACSPLEDLVGELELVKHELKRSRIHTAVSIASTMGDTGGLHYITDDGDDSDKLCVVCVNSSDARLPHMSLCLFFRLDPIAYPKHISALAVKSDSEDVLASATANHDRSVVQKSAMPIHDILLR